MESENEKRDMTLWAVYVERFKGHMLHYIGFHATQQRLDYSPILVIKDSYHDGLLQFPSLTYCY